MALRIFTLCSFLFLLGPSVQANVVSRSDVEYHSVVDHNYEFIAPKAYFSWLPELTAYNRYFKSQYEKSYHWVLDETTALILASEQNQIANGFATVVPNVKTVFFPSGAELLDQFAVKSWLYTLLSHETAHLYQLNVKQGLSKISKQVVGNSVAWLPLGFPIFIHPNILAPTFMTEGNAVMNESRFGLGGRLYSGEYRALVFSQIKANQINSTRLINDHLDFPFGTEKYLVGGYFNSYLVDTYGLNLTNRFFYHQSNHYFNPLRLKSTFERTFGSGYDLLIYEFSEHFRPLAEQQASSQEEAFANSLMFTPLNHDEEKIFFLTTDARSEPYLNVFNKESGVLQREQIDLPSGKLFQLEDQRYYAAASYIVDTTDTKYSLFGESYNLRSEFLSQIVQDIRGGHRLSISATTSFVEPQLYLDGKFYASSHSSAILDGQGNVYYFRQEGEERQLFKNKKKLLSYKGYYGKPLEVDDAGLVYFIASTEFGSSLFAAAYGEIVRLSPSDTIVDARKVSPGKFLVAEVGSDGYSYKLISSKAKPERPYSYEYSFSSEPQIQTFNESLEEDKINEDLLSKASSYSAFRSLRFSTMSLGLLANSQGDFYGQALADFTDPLQYHNISLGYGRGFYGTNSALISYQNAKNRLAWYVGYNYSESAEVETLPDDSFEVVRTDHRDLAFVGLNYPLFHRERWHLAWNGELGWINESDTSENELSLINQLQLTWSQRYGLGFSPYRHFGLTLAHQALQENQPKDQTDQAWGLFANTTYDLGGQNYLTGRAGWALSGSGSIEMGDTALLHSDAFFVSRLVPGTSVDITEAQVLGLGFKKAFEHSYYFSRFPISLRRWAPLIQSNYYLYREKLNEPDEKYLTEFFVGAEVELLVAHKLPVRFAFGHIESTLEEEAAWRFVLSSESRF